MYFSNGFVYGGEPAEMLKVSSVKVLDNMMMLIRFNTGETRLFDASVLEGRIFLPLRDRAIFQKPEIDHGVVTWMNGEIDCSPEFMYDKSYEYEEVG
ncbi:MAG: DUF2442 domain-containing protein [Oscillospiraceae bacterium]|nr:DUF2442 domain-containing protein [Oscillospiraceae bacterium]